MASGTDSRSSISGDVSSASDHQSESSELSADDMRSHVMELNRNLIQQLDALKLRLEIDFKQGQEQRSALLVKSDSKLEDREKVLSKLKQDVREKSTKLEKLSTDNDKKTKEITELQSLIEGLRKNVGDTRIYADELETEMQQLQLDKSKLQTGSAYQEKEEEIRSLHRELTSLKRNLTRMDRELAKAKELIGQQGSRIRVMENENKNTLIKFKEELNKISYNMKFEIRRMRDLMSFQWREMKDLREQNESMTNDIREIRNLLLEQNRGKSTPSKESKTPEPMQVHMRSDRAVTAALKPAFPARSKDKANIKTRQNRF